MGEPSPSSSEALQEANIDWLKSQGYRYQVVSREPTRQFYPEQAIDIETATGDTVRGQKVLSKDWQKVRLYCYSQARRQKEEAMASVFAKVLKPRWVPLPTPDTRHHVQNTKRCQLVF